MKTPIFFCRQSHWFLRDFAYANLANAQTAPAANPTNVSGKVVSFKGAELIVASPTAI